MKNFAEKNVAILGVGIEGLAVAKFLDGNYKSLTFLDQFSEGKVLENASEENGRLLTELLKSPKVKTIFSNQYMDSLSDFDVIFRTPAISVFNEKIREAQKSGVEISSQLKLFFDLCPSKIIGVTGTKGKGTTSSLIYEILRNNNKQSVYLAGNIGYPALDLLAKVKPGDLVILELSNFQLMDMHKSPTIAVITNLTEDHLDFHKNKEEYLNAKINILAYQGGKDTAILNSSSTFPDKYLQNIKSQILWFGRNKGKDQCIVAGDKVVYDPPGEDATICRLSEIKLLGRHNLENIAAATLAAKQLGVDNQTIIKTVKEFVGLPHRLEFVRELNGVKYINDSFATNPGPTMAAIKAFPENKIMILGGSSKGADFSELAQEITKSNVSEAVLIGDEAPKIQKALEEAEYKGKIFSAGQDFQQAIDHISATAKAGDYVILSPACASFDMFKNYKIRGEKFKEAVMKLT